MYPMKWSILKYFIPSGKEVPDKTWGRRESKLELSFTGIFLKRTSSSIDCYFLFLNIFLWLYLCWDQVVLEHIICQYCVHHANQRAFTALSVIPNAPNPHSCEGEDFVLLSMLVVKNTKRMAYLYTSYKKLSYSQLLKLHYWVHRLPEFGEYNVVGGSCLPALATNVFSINLKKKIW